MKIIDAHHHLWNRDLLSYPWLDDSEAEAFYGSYASLRRNYLLEDYLADAADIELVKSVHVQADHDDADPVAETLWLQGIADAPGSGGFPHAIVAFADLASKNVEQVLEGHLRYANVRGIRQMLNYSSDTRLTYTSRNLLEDPGWTKGFGLLAKYNLSFDLQLYAGQMSQAAALAQRHPDTVLVLDHTGMPVERDEPGLAAWRAGMRELANCRNVSVKISGLGMCEPAWTELSIRPFVLSVIDWFGPERCMFGSNFPVDSLFSSFESVFEAFDNITKEFSDSERSALFHDNAERIYRL